MNTEPKNTASQKVREPLSSTKRFFIIVRTYIIGALMVPIIVAARHFPDLKGPEDFFFALLSYLFLFASVILFLPGGVLPALEWISNYVFKIPLTLVNRILFPTPANIFATLLMVLSYILFFAILIQGITATKPGTFRLLYFVLLGFVIINAGGCLVLYPPG